MMSFNSDIPTSRLERLTSSLLVTRSTTELSGIYLSYLSTKYKVFLKEYRPEHNIVVVVQSKGIPFIPKLGLQTQPTT